MIVIARLGVALYWAAICAISGAMLIAFWPGLPAATSLDNSWIVGMNEAMRLGLDIGTQFVFTFGPYASVYTQEWSAATDALMLFGGTVLAACHALLFGLLGAQRGRIAMLVLAATFMVVLRQKDALLFVYPLAFALHVASTYLDLGAGRVSPWHRHPALFGLLLLPFGLLPLIKGSALVAVAAIGSLCMVALIVARQPRRALLLAVVPPAACIAFWLIAGQPLRTLPGYFVNMVPIITGYTDAMSARGPTAEIGVFALGVAGVLLAVALAGGASRWTRLFLLTAFALHLFLAFKAGFVRHDGHVLMAGAALGMAAMLTLPLRSPAAPLAVALGLLAWTCFDANHARTSTETLVKRAVNPFLGIAGGLAIRSDGRLLAMAEQRRIALAAECPLPKLDGRVDIYSYRQACLIVSGNQWSPRPVFQSYSAYTPRLAQMNADHLRGDRAPDHVLFRVEPIDGRLPALEDGPSWPALLQRYAPRALDDDLLHLERRPQAQERLPVYDATRTLAVDERFDLSPHEDLLLATIDLPRSLLGRLASIVFKPTPPRIELTLADGSLRDYRLVPGMSAAGFLLSPHVSSTREFLQVQEGSAEAAPARVRSLRIRVDRAGRWLWSDTYELRLAPLKIAHSDTSLSRRAVAPALRDAPLGGRIDSTLVCDGSIDRINGLSPAPSSVRTSATIHLDGWTAVAHREGRLADQVLVAVTAADGKVRYFPTRVKARPDVSDHFKQPGLLNSGFEASIDIGALGPQLRLQLALVSQGRLIHCEPVRTVNVIR